ncbi:MAG: PSD1 and planctomycete cytochrome C domain-containing protein [Planctomycetota bacterium]
MKRFSIAILISAFAAPIFAADIDPAALKFFEEKIRPILADNCYSCHSVSAKKLKGKLYLDSREGVARGGENGQVVVPGDPDKSHLIQAVRYKLKDQEMPPDGPLKPDEVAALEQWVKMGCPDPRTSDVKLPTINARVIDIDAGKKFWSFQPLKKVEPPKVANAAWCKTPLDNFVLSKLEEKKVAPNPELDKRRLARRAYFDATGLPPTPEQVDAFVNDPSPDAYSKLVDSLLASDHFGEKWARHWLDIARFAESHGYEQDYDRQYAFHFRDFAIQAFNQDLPYDTFVKWQLAGDEFAPENPLAMKATGFLAAGTHATQITANQAEKERYDELDDMVQTMGTGMLGLTFGCARCHDHKFDPITARDYYRLVSTFTKTVRSEVELDFDGGKTAAAKAAFAVEHKPFADALAAYERDHLPKKLAEWEAHPTQKAANTKPAWVALEISESKSEGGATFTKQDDGSLLVSGAKPKFDTYTFTARTDLKGITGVRLEAMADPSMIKSGPGRANNGNFALSDFKVTIRDASKKDAAPVALKLQNPKADFEQKGLPVKATIDADATSSWAIDPQFGKDHKAIYETEGVVGFDGGTTLTFTLHFNNNDAHSMGRPRLSITTMPRPLQLESTGLPPDIATVLGTPAAKRSAAQKKKLLAYFKPHDAEWVKLNKAVQDHLALAPKSKGEMVMISSEGTPAIRNHTQGPDFYEKTFYLKRGDLNQKQEEAPNGFPLVLVRAGAGEKHWQTPPPPGAKTLYKRVGLANWITDVENGAGHLLARVIVNRLWAQHMGYGIVSTPSDFGFQGTRPSDPDLLDYLASELIANGWHLKPIHKLIMTSAAFLQDSAFDKAKAAADPENKLFWRRKSVRLEAESIRDSMLAVSGQLDPRMFGPGTLSESDRRRSVYLTVKRSKLNHMLTLFDATSATQSVGQRPSTTVAPQALELLNSPFVRDCSKAFAKRLAPKADTPFDESIKNAYLLALGRAPDATEAKDSLEFLTEMSAKTSREKALSDFCQAIMGLNEFVYVE